MIDGAKENIKAIGKGDNYFEGKTFTADANYHSSENIKKCEEEKLDAYIPDVDFRKRDSRLESQKKYKEEKVERYELEEFRYDAKSDSYLCPKGKRLSRKSSRSIKEGYLQYAAKKEECIGCEDRNKCLRMPNGIRKYLTIAMKNEDSISKRMRDKIDTKEGRLKYERRLAIVEPVFGNIKAQKGLNRFTLRTKAKVDIQWRL